MRNPIREEFFHFVKQVTIVRSDDDDLVSIVKRNNGRVTTPYPTSIVYSFAQLQKNVSIYTQK